MKGPCITSSCELACAASQLTHRGTRRSGMPHLAYPSLRHGHDRTLEGLIVAVVDGAAGVDPGGRRADHRHHRGGGEHHD